MPLPVTFVAILAAITLAMPAHAQEVFGGAYRHAVDTPLTLHTGEGGADISAGYRFPRIEALGVIGKPAPYVIAAINTSGDTSFAGAGLSWSIGKGPVYVRPGIGIVVHDGPTNRLTPGYPRDTGLGSKVLFEPEFGVGYRFSPHFSAEASWLHVSHAQLFKSGQNPGIDMIGVRLNWRVR